MNRATIDLWVGIFVVIGIGALLFLALKVGNLATFSAGETYNVQARFVNIGGLKVRAPIKSVVFGVAVTWIAVFEGYDAVPTAEGVSRATTRTVVTSSLAILALDFVLTALMFTGGKSA